MQRRTFLKRGLLGGALLAIGGGTALVFSPGKMRYSPTAPLRVLNRKTFNVMAAIAARVVTAPGANPVAIAHTIDESLARAVPEAQHDIVQVLGLFDNALIGLLVEGQPHAFTRLDGPAQDAALYAWRDSPLVLLRGAYRALKNLCTTSFYRKESAWPIVGYPGPPEALITISQNGGVNPPGSVQ